MKIIIKDSLLNLPEHEQDYWFRMSRENEIYCTDINGELWQVLDFEPVNHNIAAEDEDYGGHA